jgi:hypothetical protein
MGIMIAEIIIIISSLLVTGAYTLSSVYGVSVNENRSNWIDANIDGLIKGCTNLIHNNDTTSTYSVLCGSMTYVIQNLCKDQYYPFCFGDEWEEYNKERNMRVYGNATSANYDDTIRELLAKQGIKCPTVC